MMMHGLANFKFIQGHVLMIKVSQYCMQKQVKPCNSVMTLQADKVTIMRIQQLLNNTSSMVGIAWVTVCCGVTVCSQELTMQMEVTPSPQTSKPV